MGLTVILIKNSDHPTFLRLRRSLGENITEAGGCWGRSPPPPPQKLSTFFKRKASFFNLFFYRENLYLLKENRGGGYKPTCALPLSKVSGYVPQLPPSPLPCPMPVI